MFSHSCRKLHTNPYSLLDTTGYFSRSITDMSHFGHVWYGDAVLGNVENVPAPLTLMPAKNAEKMCVVSNRHFVPG